MKKYYCNGKKDFCHLFDGEDLPDCTREECANADGSGGEVIDEAIDEAIDEETPPKILYLCDLKKCDNCSFPTCRHTADITHAVNFEFNGAAYEETSGTMPI